MQQHHTHCLAWVALVCTGLGCGSSGGSSPTAPTSVAAPATQATRTITNASVSATPAGDLQIGGIESTTLTITVDYSDESTSSISATCTPESNSVYTITADCIVTAVGEGSRSVSVSGPTGILSFTITVLEKCCTVAGWVGKHGGGWVENATVRIGSVANTRTDNVGYFKFEIDESGILPVVIEANGFYKSEGYLDVNLGKRVPINGVKAVHALRYLLPNNYTSVFDLNFYDHVLRKKGARGTRRWASMPTVEIFTNQMECLETKNNEGKSCTKYKATSTATPSAFETSIRRVVNEDFSRLTDEVLTGVSITTTSHTPGTIIYVDSCATPDKISVAYMTRGSSNFSVSGTTYSVAYSCHWSSGEVRGVDIIMNAAHLSLHHVYVHEFAHGLGWSHPDGIPAVPRPSIMSPITTISNLDRLSGRVLYKYRPAGSMSPDKDPAGNTMNYPTETRVFDFYSPNMHTGLEMLPSVMAPNLFDDGPAFPLGQGLFQGPLIEEIDY